MMTLFELFILYSSWELDYKIKVREHWLRINKVCVFQHTQKKLPYYNWLNNAPNSYTHQYWSKHRAKEKRALRRELQGLEGDFPYNHRCSYTYNYW